jgi:hypothetical protein
MLVLQETPAGFALFKVDDAKVKAAEKEVRVLWLM